MDSTRVPHRWLPTPPINSEKAALYGLTDVEAEALAAVSTGRTDKAAAEELGIHLSTFKARVRNAFAKLRLNDRAAATLYCSVAGIFAPFENGLPGRLQPPLDQLIDPRQQPIKATFNTAVSFELQEIRLARDLTRGDLAERTDIPEGTIRAYESGRPVTTDRLYRMCKALDVRSDAVIQLAEMRLLLRAMRSHALAGHGALAKLNLDTDEIENYEDRDDTEQNG